MKTKISRAKFENIAYLTLNVVNMIVFLMVFAASIVKAKEGTLAEIIQAIYCTIMSFLLILHEFLSPAWTHIYFGFLNIHSGKGVLMLFLGCLVMCEVAYNIIVSIFAFTIGLVYLILSLIPTIPPPNSFLVHWKNHKDFWAEGLDLNVIPNQIITTNIKNDIVSYPHPSAWHPASCSKMTAISRQSSAFLTPIYNTDYTQYQQQLPPQDTNHLCVY